MTPYKKIKRHKTKREKIIILMSIIATLLLSFFISVITKTEETELGLELLQTDSSEFNHNGSAVRKETQIRKDYEKNYRQKNNKWNDKYVEILENKEDDKKLNKLDLNDTTKNEN